jgi:dihydrofolate reductase
MEKLVYGLNQSLDGYLDHMALGPPVPAAFRHFVELVRGLTGVIYGRRMYEIMRYWDEDLPDWDAEDRDFAVAWRCRPKWVVSRSLKSVGPNATLVADDFEKVIRKLKAELAGEIHVGGPVLAQSLTEAGLIDEYWLYLRPVVLGGGQPFFARPPPSLHLVASDLIAGDVIRYDVRSCLIAQKFKLRHYRRSRDEHRFPDRKDYLRYVLVGGKFQPLQEPELH